MDNVPIGCCKFVLPLTFDNSLSYYEQICKIIGHLNSILSGVNMNTDEINAIKTQIQELEYIIKNFDKEYIEKVVDNYIATMIFVEINDSGYIVYNIPSSWGDIYFKTAGLDENLPDVEYGTLLLYY